MQSFFVLLVSIFFLSTADATPVTCIDTLPVTIRGNFADDYGIHYNVTDSLFWQLPKARYHILEANTSAQYILAKNDANNGSEPGLYTRIDYMYFTGMEPYNWGFCYTVYKAASLEEAKQAAGADKLHPRTGCNGFPFSRMKRTE